MSHTPYMKVNKGLHLDYAPDTPIVGYRSRASPHIYTYTTTYTVYIYIYTTIYKNIYIRPYMRCMLHIYTTIHTVYVYMQLNKGLHPDYAPDTPIRLQVTKLPPNIYMTICTVYTDTTIYTIYIYIRPYVQCMCHIYTTL